MEPEAAHTLALQSLKLSGALLPNTSRTKPNDSRIDCLGMSFPSRLGLAAGCDKNGDYIDALGAVGFGFIEVGTVTPRAQSGRPRPRLFRFPRDLAIVNRMGFNNKGVEHVVHRLKTRKFSGVCGVNIGKNADTPNDRAVDDYLKCLRSVYAHADYVTVNISSPNTPGLRDLQSSIALQGILGALHAEREKLEQAAGKRVPILVKVSPDMTQPDLVAVASVLRDLGVDGVVATNTTTNLHAISGSVPAGVGGGLSGKPLLESSLRAVTLLRSSLDAKTVIVGVGGITDAVSAQAMLNAGANLLQVYTGLVYKGPALLQEIYDGMRNARVA